MKKQILVLLCLYVAIGYTLGQEKKTGKPQLEFSGYVAAEIIYDSRGVVTASDGDILLYPLPKQLDSNGEDTNANGSLSFIGTTSRVRLAMTPISLLGGELSAFMEFDFAASALGKKMTSRLRHAVIRFDRKKETLILGQYWHPMFMPVCTPELSSVVGGAIFISFARSPQLRYTHHFRDDFRASIIASSQSDSKSPGGKGSSSEYIQKSLIPEFNVHLEYGDKNSWILGAVAGVKKLKPRLVNEFGNKVDESVTSFHTMVYGKIRARKVEYKLQGFYVQNGYELLMLGGYGVSNIDLKTGKYEYSPLTTASVWAEIKTHIDSPFNFGLFGGYVKNLGAEKKILTYYSRGKNIDKMYRFAPRVVYRKGPLSMALECNQTYTYYGTVGERGEVDNSEGIGSTRLQFYVRYFF